MGNLKWFRSENQGTVAPAFNILRAAVPGGWLITSTQGTGSLAYVPDPAHGWDGSSEPSRFDGTPLEIPSGDSSPTFQIPSGSGQTIDLPTPVAAITKVFYVNTQVDDIGVVGVDTLIQWGYADPENMPRASLILKQKPDGTFRHQGAIYNQLNFAFELVWGLPIEARIELDAGAIHVANLSKSIYPITNETRGIGRASITLKPEDVQLGAVVVFAASFEAGRGGLITQHMIYLARRVTITGSGIEITVPGVM